MLGLWVLRIGGANVQSSITTMCKGFGQNLPTSLQINNLQIKKFVIESVMRNGHCIPTEVRPVE